MASESGANLDNPTSKPLEIAIIGGGIGGLTLLLGLLNHTDPKIIKPHIYEAAAEFSEIGAGVGFGPNALQALGIVLPELQERFFTLATDAYADVIDGVKRPIWNEMFMGMDGKSEKCPLKAGDRIMNVCFDARKQNWKKNVHRARWLEQMVETLPGGTGAELVTFGKRCTDVQRQENGRGFIIKFADGTEAKADAVVGCDGVKSRVRQILLTMNDDEQAINPRFSGKYAYRGLIPIDEAVAAIGEVANRTHMWYGYDGHFVCFPIDKGKVLNVVAFHTKADGKWDSMDWVLPATVEEALEDFADWPENIRKMVGAIRKPDKWMLFEHPPAKSYCDESGRICLLGDCAHASTPHNGAGAGVAVEDAAVLSRLLGALEHPDPSALAAAFKTYDAVRLTRTQKLVTASRDAALLYEFQKPGILDDMEKVKADLQERYKWLWEFDMEQHCQQAVRKFRDAGSKL